MLNEFDIIDKYFKNLTHNNLLVDIGDDAAVIDVRDIQDICITTDTLVAGTHFLPSAPAHSIGYKALAVNLSDIAAMGGTPKWFTLALTLPENDEKWLQEFSEGLAECASRHKVQLIGGDLTKGPLTITITAIGALIKSKKVTRSGANPGDGIFVTGDLGLPAGILTQIFANNNKLPDTLNLDEENNKLYYPKPRTEIAIELTDYATAMIDISDGLLADLNHILDSSKVSANIYYHKLPVSKQLKKILPMASKEDLEAYVLTGGDEYELLFTAPISHKERLINNKYNIPVALIGEIKSSKDENKFDVINENGDIVDIKIGTLGWQHFSSYSR